MTIQSILIELKGLGSFKNIEGMKRYNIRPVKAFGVTAPTIRALAKRIGKNHHLAITLWDSGFHEARILAAIIAEPHKTTITLLDSWANDIQNWAQCDTCCSELFQKTRFASSLPFRWTIKNKEFVRRAGFVMIAEMAVHHTVTADEEFEKYFPLIKKYSIDERNFVKKGVNWSLRQIGKRNRGLHKKAIALALEIQNIPSQSARWIAADALKELKDNKILTIIKRRRGSV